MVQWERLPNYAMSLPHLSSEAAAQVLHVLVDAAAFEGK